MESIFEITIDNALINMNNSVAMPALTSSKEKTKFSSLFRSTKKTLALSKNKSSDTSVPKNMDSTVQIEFSVSDFQGCKVSESSVVGLPAAGCTKRKSTISMRRRRQAPQMTSTHNLVIENQFIVRWRVHYLNLTCHCSDKKFNRVCQVVSVIQLMILCWPQVSSYAQWKITAI